ncbi:MAG TPA: oligoendopeptidase F [Candidatus Merdenecus merdavium]|nr:oligoendopeptidase F [Candidatus Merdenecus merdavium]
MNQNEVMKREDVPKEFKWKIEDIYENDAEWQKEYEMIKEKMLELSGYQGILSRDSQTFLSALELNDTINMLAERVYGYANQKLHENAGNSTYQELSNKAGMLLSELSAKLAFLVPEILNMKDEVLKRFIDEEEGLKLYQTYLTNMIRKKEHILDRETEELLAEVEEIAEGPDQIYSLFNHADLKFGEIIGPDGKKVELTHGRYGLFMESSNQDIRKGAFKAMYQGYLNFKNTLGAVFVSNLKQEAFFSKVRKYPSSLEAALDASQIPVSVYDHLIEEVHAHLPVMYDYLKLRKKVLGLEELHMYDLYVPMIHSSHAKVPYEEAKEIVCKGLEPLGEEYQKVLKEGLNGGWIDVYENQGKRSGAYSWGPYGTHPYVLLNYQDNLKNVFTLAHEMGHAIHSYYSDQNQPYVYAGYKIFVAEVASTVNETLLIHYLIENSQSEKEKAYLLNYFLEQFRSTLYRQTMFAEFEKIVHGMAEAKEPLTADALCDIYYQLNQLYYGDDVVIDEEIAMEWARIPHFYTPFYVYQYATGFSAAIAISKKILNGDEKTLDGYLQFLRSGSSMSPIELLKLCGVDMTKKEPVKEALQVFRGYLTELSKMLDK